MYETEPRYKDLRYSSSPDMTMSYWRTNSTERKIFFFFVFYWFLLSYLQELLQTKRFYTTSYIGVIVIYQKNKVLEKQIPTKTTSYQMNYNN